MLNAPVEIVYNANQQVNESDFWTKTKQELATEKDLNVFKTWRSVNSIPIYAPNECFDQYKVEVEALLKDKLNDKWIKLLKEPFLGHTGASYAMASRKAFNGTVECSAWTLKTAHHILTFETMTGKDITDYDQIVEFGSGIGETARMILDMGFKGDYLLYELPEIARIPAFYLSKYNNIKVISNYTEIPQDKKTLFIGTWSLSEVPISYRNPILSHLKGDTDFLIIFQKSIWGYDNLKYFTIDLPKLTGSYIKVQEIPWHAGWGGNYFLVSKK
jgi:hypothetical protein